MKGIILMQATRRSFSARKQFNGGRRKFTPSRRAPRGKQYIDPARFINKHIVEERAPDYKPTHLFTDFGLHRVIESNLAEAGFSAPSAIQDQALPLALEGRDVIGLANTGTGKTAAFLLPILQKLYKTRTTQSVLIMAPTRELAQQIDAEFKKFSRDMKLYAAICVGGVNITGQIRQLQRKPHVIIGTPGRLKDLINRGMLRLDTIDTLVLDEADRMLDMGFINDIRAIVQQISSDRQTLCFSATITPGVKSIINDFMRNPELVSVRVTDTNDHIHQDVVEYHDDTHKKELLTELLQQSEFEKVIVFGETKYGVQRLSDNLEKQGITSAAIHGNKSQSQRERALRAFKADQTKVLVATDVAARGLDIPDVSHVINFDQPQSYDDYVHRIGRTGRGGKTGKALTFVQKRS
ncbi:ATP-dependent RNA helicase RhlE [Candidatus Saccharibacteria bacterium RAAC3_TM7_1]|nr:ATP-dependent RNA helicase RhlE [Candidatus Saccharibacteria bacterium RAAC3_TM7_1]HCZ28834.1 ATP-dependent helicase [Candidatus Saccharibacteria bacterium]